jgi:hypothetical protein
MRIDEIGTPLAILLVMLMRSGSTEEIMAHSTIQDWTQTQVLLKYDEARDVKYRVYRDQGALFQEICDVDDTPIHTLELPGDMKMDKSSYEVLLRYVLLDVVAA